MYNCIVYIYFMYKYIWRKPQTDRFTCILTAFYDRIFVVFRWIQVTCIADFDQVMLVQLTDECSQCRMAVQVNGPSEPLGITFPNHVIGENVASLLEGYCLLFHNHSVWRNAGEISTRFSCFTLMWLIAWFKINCLWLSAVGKFNYGLGCSWWSWT